eukprot:tig00000093_g3671.t1
MDADPIVVPEQHGVPAGAYVGAAACPFMLVHAMARRGGKEKRNDEDDDDDAESSAPRSRAKGGTRNYVEVVIGAGAAEAVPGQTPGGPAQPGLLGLDYALVVARRYRLRVRNEAEAPLWAGRGVLLRLLFADDGSPVPGLDGASGPMLLFQTSSKIAIPSELVRIEFDETGTSSTFGVGASTYRHKNRTFRLVIEAPDVSADGLPVALPVAGLLVRTVTHLKSMRGGATGRGVLGGIAVKREGGSEEGPAPPPRPALGPAAAASRGELPPLPVPLPANAFFELRGLGSPSQSSHSSDSRSPLPPGAAGNVEVAPLPAGPPHPITHIFESMVRLVISEGGGQAASEPAAPEPSASGEQAEPELDMPTIRMVFESPQTEAEAGAPLPAPEEPGFPAPYRHASPAAQEAAEWHLADLAAAVAAAAAAAGVAHPVPAETERARREAQCPAWATLRFACFQLAQALAAPPSSTRSSSARTKVPAPARAARWGAAGRGRRGGPGAAGRYRARVMLEDVRLAGGSALAEGVLAAWRARLAPAPGPRPWPPDFHAREDAELFAEHAWHALDVVAGFNSFISWDLLPVDRDYVFALLEGAERAIRGHAAPEAAAGCPLLYSRALVRRARALEQARPPPPRHASRTLRRRAADAAAAAQFRETGAATELYFRAWTLLQRAGHSPSRLEAHLLRELVDILLRVPVASKLEMAARLAQRIYWFCETEDDRYQHALCLQTLALEQQMRGQYRSARAALRQALELLGPLPPGYRLHEHRLHMALVGTSMHLLDIPAMIRHARETLARARALCTSWNECDVTYPIAARALAFIACKYKPADWVKPPDIGSAIATMRCFVFLLQQLEEGAGPAGPCMRAHALHHLALMHQYVGETQRALACFERAAAHYAEYPAYFPPTLPRVRKLHAAAAACRAALATGGSAGTSPAWSWSSPLPQASPAPPPSIRPRFAPACPIPA